MNFSPADQAYCPPQTPTIRQIIDEVAEKHGFTYVEMVSQRRTTKLVQARQEAYWRCMKETLRTCAFISAQFGGRDHTTIIKGAQTYEKRMRGGE